MKVKPHMCCILNKKRDLRKIKKKNYVFTIRTSTLINIENVFGTFELSTLIKSKSVF